MQGPRQKDCHLQRQASSELQLAVVQCNMYNDTTYVLLILWNMMYACLHQVQFPEKIAIYELTSADPNDLNYKLKVLIGGGNVRTLYMHENVVYSTYTVSAW